MLLSTKLIISSLFPFFVCIQPHLRINHRRCQRRHPYIPDEAIRRTQQRLSRPGNTHRLWLSALRQKRVKRQNTKRDHHLGPSQLVLRRTRAISLRKTARMRNSLYGLEFMWPLLCGLISALIYLERDWSSITK